MQFFSVLVVVVLLYKKDVSCFLKIAKNTIIPNTNSKDYNIEELNGYLKNILNKEELGPDVTLSFPKSLTHPKYRLSDGKVDRFYDPLHPHGFYDSIMFHKLDNDFYGVIQVYGPKIDFSFKYETSLSGSPQTGRLGMLVNHDPLQLQIEFGQVKGDTCVINKEKNDVHYFYKKQIKSSSKIQPEVPAGEAAGKQLERELIDSWVPDLYGAILKVKVEKLARDAKTKILQDPSSRSAFQHICKNVA